MNERITPNPIEPRGLVAHYDGSKLTVWASKAVRAQLERGDLRKHGSPAGEG